MIPNWNALTAAAIRILLQKQRSLPADLLQQLSHDPRASVRKLARAAWQKQQRRQEERSRVERLLKLERSFWRQGVCRVAGVDEAGVGPLAGPVVAAAVIFRRGAFLYGINDSKQLQAPLRKELAQQIHSRAMAVAVGAANVAEIDRFNIYQASLLAMRRAVAGLSAAPQVLLIDARSLPELPIPQLAVKGGDRLHFSIAAASIIAKTHRDEIMCRIDSRYPGYGFARHKGYATREHRDALRRNGPCPAHRLSFRPVREALGAHAT